MSLQSFLISTVLCYQRNSNIKTCQSLLRITYINSILKFNHSLTKAAFFSISSYKPNKSFNKSAIEFQNGNEHQRNTGFEYKKEIKAEQTISSFEDAFFEGNTQKTKPTYSSANRTSLNSPSYTNSSFKLGEFSNKEKYSRNSTISTTLPPTSNAKNSTVSGTTIRNLNLPMKLPGKFIERNVSTQPAVSYPIGLPTFDNKVSKLDENVPFGVKSPNMPGFNASYVPVTSNLGNSNSLLATKGIDSKVNSHLDLKLSNFEAASKIPLSTDGSLIPVVETSVAIDSHSFAKKHTNNISTESDLNVALLQPQSSIISRLGHITGIKPSTIDLLCTSSNAEINCTEFRFGALATRSFIPTNSSGPASFTTPFNTRSSVHELSILERKPFSIPKDQLVSCEKSIVITISNSNEITELVSRTTRGFFGIYSAINSSSDTLFILFNDPLSAMILYQKTNIPAISIPLWIEDQLQLKHLTHLISKSFSKVIIFSNSSGSDLDLYSSLQPTEQYLSMLLQRWRCYIVPIHGNLVTCKLPTLWASLKDLFENKGITNPKEHLLNSAIPMPSKNVAFTSKYFEQIRNEIALGNQALWGTPLKWSLPELTKVIKGLREGELTILSGPTGVGKTTILSLLSLDWCEQGVPTLWGSFEIPNHRIIKKMMIQRRGEQFSEDPTLAVKEFERESESFSKLPLYFMNFFGSSSPFSEVLETMAWAVQKRSIKHILLDNLQFMTSGHGVDRNSNSFSKFDHTDRIISEIRRFATEMNCHVTLVIHPRKEQDNSVLGICSVSGTAKATQEADNVLILQKIGQKRSIDVRKNRFDGELGRITYKFDPNSLRVTFNF